jgi:hypothetical protein
MQNAAIHIATPCHESWAAMTPTSDGRHCTACAKTVVDFTQQTDAEILAYFQQVGRGKTCGRFRAEQVKRPLLMRLPPRQVRRWQVWLTSLCVAAVTIQGCQTTVGEPTPVHTIAPQVITSDSVEVVDSAAVVLAPYPTPISGRVVDLNSQQPVAGVLVHLKNTAATVITDAQGLFAFAEDATPVKATYDNPFVLHLSAANYPACDFVLDYRIPPSNQALQVISASYPLPETILGDVEILP